MAKIKKSEESGPQLFFNFTWKYVPQLFLGTPRAEKMTFSQKTARVWFDDTYPLNQWHVLSGKISVSPLEQFVKHHFGSADMCHFIANLIIQNFSCKNITNRDFKVINFWSQVNHIVAKKTKWNKCGWRKPSFRIQDVNRVFRDFLQKSFI